MRRGDSEDWDEEWRRLGCGGVGGGEVQWRDTQVAELARSGEKGVAVKCLSDRLIA